MRGRVRYSIHIVAVLLVVGIALVWFGPVFEGKSFTDVGGLENVVYPWKAFPNPSSIGFPQADQSDLTYPWETELSRAVHEGTLPLWNPDSFGGQPLFANGSSGQASPLRLVLARFFDADTTHNVLSIVYVTLAGVFTYLLLVDLGVAPGAAVFGAVAWMLGSFTLDWVQLDVVAPIFSFLPAGMVAIRRAVRGSPSWAVISAVVAALLFLSAHILLAGVTVAAIFTYGLCLAVMGWIRDWRRYHDRRPLRSPAMLVLVGLLTIGLPAFVLLPTLDVIGYVGRIPLTYGKLVKSFLFPLSAMRYTLTHPPPPITARQLQVAVFSGTAPVLLAAVGLFSRRRGYGLGRGLVIGSLLVAVGGPGTWIAFHLVPGMNVFRPYSRLMFLFDFGVAVLAALGLDRVLRAVAGHRRAEPDGVGRDHRAAPAHRRRHGRQSRSGRGALAAAMTVALVGGTALQLGSYGRNVTPFESSSAATQFPETPLIRALLATQISGGWPDRLLPVRVPPTKTSYDAPILFSNESSVFGLQSAGGYDSSVPTRTVDLWRAVDGVPAVTAAGQKLGSAYQPAFGITTARFDLLPRVGVDRIALTPLAASDRVTVGDIERLGWRQIYQGADGTVLAWSGSAIGPTVAYQAQWVPVDRTALVRFTAPEFPYRNSVILDERVPHADVSPEPTGQYQVLSSGISFNDVAIRVRTSAPGWLVVPNMWDPGWSAAINGRPAAVLRADYNEQAVAIPAGLSEVMLVYRPVGLRAGVGISVAAAAAGVAVLVADTVRRRRRRRAVATWVAS